MTIYSNPNRQKSSKYVSFISKIAPPEFAQLEASRKAPEVRFVSVEEYTAVGVPGRFWPSTPPPGTRGCAPAALVMVGVVGVVGMVGMAGDRLARVVRDRNMVIIRCPPKRGQPAIRLFKEEGAAACVNHALEPPDLRCSLRKVASDADG